MTIQECGDAGYLEKGGHRIYINQWCIHNDGALTLVSGDENGFKTDGERQKNDQNSIFIASITPWHLTQGTKIVLLKPKDKEKTVTPKDKETTISENTKCDVSCKSPIEHKTTCIHFDDISAWTFEPHNPN
jgi:protein-tyrosine phosphatase